MYSYEVKKEIRNNSVPLRDQIEEIQLIRIAIIRSPRDCNYIFHVTVNGIPLIALAFILWRTT